MRSLIDILDLSTTEIDELIKTGCDIIENPKDTVKVVKAKNLQHCFLNPQQELA